VVNPRLVMSLNFDPIDFEADDLFSAARLLSQIKACCPTKLFLSRWTKRVSPISNGEYFAHQSTLSCCCEIDVDQEQPGFNARDIERQHAGGLDIKRAAAFHQRVPNTQRVISRPTQIR